MRERTAELHAAAERTGIVAELFTGQISQSGYALYLRNLLPAYQAIEHALLTTPELAQPRLCRAGGIIADLQELNGEPWATALPLLPAAEKYAARIAWSADHATLIAHCYTRYLGDLNGGQLLADRLRHLFGPNFKALHFTDFADAKTLRRTYRDQLDRAGRALHDPSAAIEEAALAFQLNIDLSLEAVEAAALLPPRHMISSVHPM